MGNLGLGQTRSEGGQTDLSGRGKVGLVPVTGFEDTGLGRDETGHDGVTDTDLVAGSSLLTLILSDEISETSDNVTSDSSSLSNDSSLSVSASDTSILCSSSVTGPRASTPTPEACPLK